MTHSTTNTAAREVMAKHDADAVRCNFSKCGCDYCAALRPTLTQQQGGEQEATCAGCNGRGEVGGWAGDGYQTDPCPFCTPSGLPDALTGDFDCPKAAECRACPCGFCTALRSKQPAASEGDGRDWRLKLRDELRNTSKQVDHATAMEGWEVAMCEISEIAGNSSDDRIIRRARRVQEWIEAHRPTPPRHPADEGMAIHACTCATERDRELCMDKQSCRVTFPLAGTP